jgi:diguanylate cyclase (GGDEF)-like protein
MRQTMTLNVLIVDDDSIDREMIRRALQKDHLDIVFQEASTVDEGIALYDQSKFDVVLLDYHMPRRDGIEMVLELRGRMRNYGSAVIMMSSSEDEKLALACLRAGAQDFIPKSEVNSARLRRAVIHSQVKFNLERELRQSYNKVKQLAESDALTGLANRFLFDEALKIALANNKRNQHILALILIDIDRFKFINDAHGHDVGDELLQKLVTRINGCLRGDELFARVGGDEFAIMVTNLASTEDSSVIASRILKILEEPFDLAHVSLNVSISIGIATHPGNSSESKDIIKNADIALYRAKDLGRNQICYFEEAMQQEFIRQYHLESALSHALKNNEFNLYYQPVLEPNTEKLVGAEALLRWRHNGQFIAPDEFIPLAERVRLINGIGRWVIRTAIEQLAIWNRNRASPLSIAINISAVQLEDADFASFINITLIEFNISPASVELEITETALIKPNDIILATINEIDAMGCRIALDDFGTGYSSISHLHQFPIDTVKIDKSLMPKTVNDQKSIALIMGLVGMIRSLNLSIVAEGVELDHQVTLCQQLNIGRVQGYYYSQAIDSKEFHKNYL